MMDVTLHVFLLLNQKPHCNITLSPMAHAVPSPLLMTDWVLPVQAAQLHLKSQENLEAE